MTRPERATTAFEHDDEYRALNEQAHPRVPPRLSAPALNWHAAIWNPSSKDSHLKSAVKAFDNWSRSVAELIVSILNQPCNRLLSVNGDEMAYHDGNVVLGAMDVLGFGVQQVDGKLALRKGPRRPDGGGTSPFKLQTFACSLFWREQLAKISVELHREYLTFTVWLPAFHAAVEGTRPAVCGGATGEKLRTYQACLLRYVLPETTWEELDEVLMLDGIAEPELTREAIAEYLYVQIWRQFSDDQLQPYFSALPDRKAHDLIKAQLRMFADFRSIILPSAFPHNVRDSQPGSPPVDFSATFTEPRAGEPPVSKIMGRMGRFLEEESAARAELSGTLFLDGRTIYLSSYGSPASAKRLHSGDGRSARYIMLTKPGSRWQLGRLVERLNVIGTFRLAALRNLGGLNAASEDIRAIGRRADEFQVAGPLSPLDGKRAFNALRQSFANITKRPIVGGLNYRIERSRYYVESFNRTLPGLRIGRIEGYQPYDEFVSRRYAATWDRISRLGFRYSRLQQRLEFLNGLINTSEQIIQSEEQNRQTKAIERQAESQVHLLRTAEYVGIFPVTYYTAGTLGGVFHVFGVATGEHGAVIAPWVAMLYLLWLLGRAGGRAEAAENAKLAAEESDAPTPPEGHAVDLAGTAAGNDASDISGGPVLGRERWLIIGAMLVTLMIGVAVTWRAFQPGALVEDAAGPAPALAAPAQTARPATASAPPPAPSPAKAPPRPSHR